MEILGQRCDLLGNHLDKVGVEVDAYLEKRDEDVIAGRVAAVVHLQAFLGLAEGAELGITHRDQNALVRDDERYRLDNKRIARGDEEVRVGDDGILALGVL